MQNILLRTTFLASILLYGCLHQEPSVPPLNVSIRPHKASIFDYPDNFVDVYAQEEYQGITPTLRDFFGQKV
jgi:hypothetical protein